MGFGPFSSSSETRQNTRNFDQSQTVSDNGVAYRTDRSGNVRIGRKGTLIQYILQMMPGSVPTLPFTTDATAATVVNRANGQVTNAPEDAQKRLERYVWIGLAAFALVLVFLISRKKGF